VKKLSIYLVIIIALFGLLYYLDYAEDQKVNSKLKESAERLYNTTPDQLNRETREQLNDKNYQAIILPEQLNKKLADKESLIVYFFSPACVYCKETTPILNDIADEVNVDYHQLNVLQFRNEWDKYRLSATPTLIYFKDGVEAARLEGGIGDTNSREDYKEFLLQIKS
jgi:thioredoxin 1